MNGTTKHQVVKCLAVMLFGVLASSLALAAPGGGKGKGGGGGGGGGDDGGGAAANPALVFWDGSDSIDVADADGGNQMTLLGGIYGACTYPKWSPDGEHITYSSNRRLFVMNKDGSDNRDITPEGLEWSGSCAIDWSQGPAPGGSDLIAFVGVPAELQVDFPEVTDYHDVYLLNPHTGEVHNLTNNSYGVSESGVSWSHDGQSLAITRIDYSDTSYQQLIILRLDLVDGVPQVVEELDITPPGIFAPWNNISWASQSDAILYANGGDIFMATFGSSGILSVESVTGGPGQFNLGHEHFPTWAPQDDAIAFVVVGDRQRDSGVYRMDLATGTTERILKSGPRWPDWNPAWSEAP
jgi:Tol biopolymer transport system component